MNPTIWESNPKLKKLLLVLIVVFLLCGILLAFFSVWQKQYRQEIYYETEGGLPVHKSQKILEVPSSTTSEVKGWKTYKNDEYGFEVSYPASFVPEANVDSEVVLSLYRSYGEGNGVEYVAFHKIPDQGSFKKNLDYAKINLNSNFKNFQGSNWKGLYQVDENPKQGGGGGDSMYIVAPGKIYLAEQYNGQGNLTHELFLQIITTFKFTK